ncbi:methyltransferase domain-containing protein [Pokkaliibacter plantistimulans]|nr:methyltransferase domain-containing protein [Pokkaliibacter plantistimulans]
MHATSMESMQRCIDWYLSDKLIKVVDLGAMNVNGSYRELFPENVEFIGVDLEPGPGVDIVLEDVYKLPFEDNSVDLILSGQMLEHCGQFWRVFSEVARVLKPEGMSFMIAPSTGPVHRYPVDCYRFYPDSYQALAEWSGLRLIHSWTDERGPWCDIVGVFQKGGEVQKITVPRTKNIEAGQTNYRNADEKAEKKSGVRDYLDVIKDIHALLKPRTYIEIGVQKGRSLNIASCDSIAIDPYPHKDLEITNSKARLFKCSSDDFFFFHAEDELKKPCQLAFIDGMHLSEYVYRDFINVERAMSPNGVIIIDDVFPNHPIQGERKRQSQVWMGDVWRFAEFLSENRPDLKLTWLDTFPSGLLVISRLRPKHRVLWQLYNQAIKKFSARASRPVPNYILTRENSVAPTLENIQEAISR